MEISEGFCCVVTRRLGARPQPFFQLLDILRECFFLFTLNDIFSDSHRLSCDRPCEQESCRLHVFLPSSTSIVLFELKPIPVGALVFVRCPESE